MFLAALLEEAKPTITTHMDYNFHAPVPLLLFYIRNNSGEAVFSFLSILSCV